MPIYEYHCSKCGDFETMQKMSDKPLTTCPTCRRKVTKLISSTTFHLKGSGWYVTDYARKGEGGGAKAADKKGEDKKSDDKKSDDKKSDDKKSDTATATTGESTASDSSSSETPAKTSKSSDKGSKKSEKAAVA
jgi:putative FmdB family regulatory protein